MTHNTPDSGQSGTNARGLDLQAAYQILIRAYLRRKAQRTTSGRKSLPSLETPLHAPMEVSSEQKTLPTPTE